MLSNSTKNQRKAQRQAAAAAASYGPPGHLRYSDDDEFGFSFSPPRAMPHKQQAQAKYVT